MFHWTHETRELAVDLACVDSMIVEDVAERVGASLSCMKKFYAANRAEIKAARLSVQVQDNRHAEVLALWGESLPREEIAARVGLSTDVVRRLILAAEMDEQPDELGASLELLALQTAHPGRIYEDDVRALTEYQFGGGHRRMSAPDVGLRSAA